MPDLPPFELVPVLASRAVVRAPVGARRRGDRRGRDRGRRAPLRRRRPAVAAAQLALLGLTAWLVAPLAERARRPRRAAADPATPGRAGAAQASAAAAARDGEPLHPRSGRRLRGLLPGGGGRDGAAVLVIGDVVGKGCRGARRSTFVRAMVTSCAPYLDDPAAILRTVNTELVHQHGASAQFITMLCVVVRPDMTMTWASAGHPPPVSLADGRPLGALTTATAGHRPRDRRPGGRPGPLPAEGILLYTDGLTDARPSGRSFQPFGESRIGLFLRELEACPPRRPWTISRAPARLSPRPAPGRPVRRRGPPAVREPVVRRNELRRRRGPKPAPSSPGPAHRAARTGNRTLGTPGVGAIRKR